MRLETFTRLWPLMRQASRVHLQGWGEPLLNPAFFEMAALARRAGCNVSTTSCGLLIDEQVARRIVDSGIDIVAFSLTGTDAASNASRRGVGFERVREAISTLQAVRRKRVGVHLEIHIAYLMLASGMQAVRALPELMKHLGVHAAVISTLDYLPDSDLAPEAFAPDDTEKRARAATLLEKTAAEARELGLEFDYALPDAGAPGTHCHENISRSLFVSADGFVSPCAYVNLPVDIVDPNRRVFGNVCRQDPLSIWQSEALGRFRDRLAAGNPDRPCRLCPKRFMD